MQDRSITEDQARAEVERRSQKISSDDVEKVLSKKGELDRKSQEGPLRRFITELKLMFAMIQDYWNGAYREVPWMTVAAVVAALVYVINPIDLIPDFIPGIGLIDDATVVAACLKLVQTDFDAYKRWKDAG